MNQSIVRASIIGRLYKASVLGHMTAANDVGRRRRISVQLWKTPATTCIVRRQSTVLFVLIRVVAATTKSTNGAERTSELLIGE